MMKRVYGWAKRTLAHHDLPRSNALFERTSRWTDRLANVTLLRLVLWVAIAAWAYQGVTSDAFKVAEWMDDHQFISWEESDRMTLLRWGQLPAWNPYWCGGTVGIAAPEDPFLGPDFLLRIAFGVLNGRRLAIMLLMVMGFEGMYRLCRRLDATVVAAGFAAVAYGTCDRFVGFLHDGWINFLGFELIPWVVLCFLKGLESWRWRLLGGFFFAWIVLSAGTYTTPFTLLALLYLTVAFSVRGSLAKSDAPVKSPRAWLTPWVVSFTIGLVALGLAFGKLLPTIAFLRQFPRVFTPVEANGAPALLSALALKYGVLLVLTLIALVSLDAVAAVFLGGALFFFLLAMGDIGWWSPFHILKSLPIFSQLRFPDRYMVVVQFFLAVCAARGVTRLEDTLVAVVRRAWSGLLTWRKRAPRPLPGVLAWLVIGLSTLLAYRVMRPQAEEVMDWGRIKPNQIYVEESARTFDQPFRQSRGNRRDAHVFPAANMGTLYCFAGNPLPESPLLRGDLAQEEYPVDPAKASVKRLSWSPNEIELEVDAKEATTIHVNQNWAPEWRSSVGTVKSDERLLAVDVPAGKHTIVLAYRDRMLMACLLVSLLSLIALLAVFSREGYRWVKAEIVRWRALPSWPDEIPAKSDDEKNDEPGS
ncbi:hypothetical protein BH11MYX4_BH11MYX4_49010 [soil metagenome]